MTKEIMGAIVEKAQSKGWELIQVKETSSSFLKFTLCKTGDTYATHLYNVNDNAFYSGNYDIRTLEDGVENLKERE